MAENDILNTLDNLSDILIDRATYYREAGKCEEKYKRIRKILFSDPRLKSNLPEFIIKCRDLDDFWEFIKNKFSHYKDRRSFIKEELVPLYNLLEPTDYPCDGTISTTISCVSSSSIKDSWEKALERRETDPEGAITSARSLLESTCKYILDDGRVDYNPGAKLPSLYKSVSDILEIAPNKTADGELKKILGGCTTIVNSLGSVRNELGDAHGKGINFRKPTNIYSQLSVNLAGTMACFLLLRWEECKPKFAGADHEKNQSR